jgi:hypothetical protein
MGFWIHWFHDHGAIIFNGLVIIGWAPLVSVGYSRSDLVLPLMLCTVYCAMVGTLVLYYKYLRTGPTLLRMGNILGRLYVRVMIYNALAFFALKC